MNKFVMGKLSFHLFHELTHDCLIAGALESSENTEENILEAKQLFFTASGRIGVVVDVDQDTSLQLTGLQRNMDSAIPAPGGLTHTAYADLKYTVTLLTIFADSERRETEEVVVTLKLLQLDFLTEIFSNAS